MGSAQLPQDLYANTEMLKESSMISSLVQLNLYNPETSSLLTEDSLSTPLTVLVPVNVAKYNKKRVTQVRGTLLLGRNDTLVGGRGGGRGGGKA